MRIHRHYALLILFFTYFSLAWLIPQGSGALVVRVGVYENAPKVFSNEKGEFVGFFPVIIQDIAKKEGWTLEFVNGTWTQGLERLENHEIDIMVDVAYSEDRAMLYDFNQVALIENWGTLYTIPGVSVTTFRDLDGLTVAVINNSIHYDGLS